MKQKDRKELQSKDIKELKTLLKNVREELFQQQLDHSLHKLSNTRSLFHTRKKIATIQSVLERKEHHVHA